MNQSRKFLSSRDRPKANGFITLRRGDDPSGGIKVRPIDFALMTQGCAFLAAFRIPETRIAVPGRRKHEPPIGAEPGDIHPVVVVELVNEFSAVGIPKARRAIIRGG